MIPWPVLVNNQVKNDSVFAEQLHLLDKRKANKEINEKEYSKLLIEFLKESTKRIHLK